MKTGRVRTKINSTSSSRDEDVTIEDDDCSPIRRRNDENAENVAITVPTLAKTADGTKKTRKKVKRGPIHPLFTELLPYATDSEFWTTFLTRCSEGELPRGCTLNGNVLSIKKANNMMNYELSGVLEMAFKQFKKLMEDNFKIGLDEREVMIKTTPIPKNWSQIRRQRIRTGMLAQYVSRLRTDMNLDEKRTRKLEYCITLCITQNLLTNDTVVLENGMISDIIPILWDGENFSIELPEVEIGTNYTIEQHPLYREYRDPPIDFQKEFESIGKSRNKKAEMGKIRRIEVDSKKNDDDETPDKSKTRNKESDDDT